MKICRILVVDDHEIFRGGLKALLARHPDKYEVVGEAANGQEAVEMAVGLKPDVVVMDITLPVMNGIEATRQILIRLPQTEVIAITAHESMLLKEVAFKAGARSFVVKSAASRNLLSALNCLRAKAAPSPSDA